MAQCSLKGSLKKRMEELRMANAIGRSRGDRKIIAGSAATTQAGWVSADYPLLDLTDARTFAAIIDSRSVSNFLAEHVWEYLSPEDGVRAGANCFKVLKQGGALRIAVPDGFHPDAEYIAQVRSDGSGAGEKDHKVLLITARLRPCLRRWSTRSGCWNGSTSRVTFIISSRGLGARRGACQEIHAFRLAKSRQSYDIYFTDR